MNTHADILAELDEYARASGLEPSTICRKATGNPRLRERLENRMKRTESDVQALRLFMANNPPSASSSEEP